MAILRKVKSNEILVGKLKHGADLIEEISNICRDYNIRLGRIEALGAVKRAKLGFYNQKIRRGNRPASLVHRLNQLNCNIFSRRDYV